MQSYSTSLAAAAATILDLASQPSKGRTGKDFSRFIADSVQGLTAAEITPELDAPLRQPGLSATSEPYDVFSDGAKLASALQTAQTIPAQNIRLTDGELEQVIRNLRGLGLDAQTVHRVQQLKGHPGGASVSQIALAAARQTPAQLTEGDLTRIEKLANTIDVEGELSSGLLNDIRQGNVQQAWGRLESAVRNLGEAISVDAQDVMALGRGLGLGGASLQMLQAAFNGQESLNLDAEGLKKLMLPASKELADRQSVLEKLAAGLGDALKPVINDARKRLEEEFQAFSRTSRRTQQSEYLIQDTVTARGITRQPDGENQERIASGQKAPAKSAGQPESAAAPRPEVAPADAGQAAQQPEQAEASRLADLVNGKGLSPDGKTALENAVATVRNVALAQAALAAQAGGKSSDRAWDRDAQGRFLADRAERQTAINRPQTGQTAQSAQAGVVTQTGTSLTQAASHLAAQAEGIVAGLTQAVAGISEAVTAGRVLVEEIARDAAEALKNPVQREEARPQPATGGPLENARLAEGRLPGARRESVRLENIIETRIAEAGLAAARPEARISARVQQAELNQDSAEARQQARQERAPFEPAGSIQRTDRAQRQSARVNAGERAQRLISGEAPVERGRASAMPAASASSAMPARSATSASPAMPAATSASGVPETLLAGGISGSEAVWPEARAEVRLASLPDRSLPQVARASLTQVSLNPEAKGVLRSESSFLPDLPDFDRSDFDLAGLLDMLNGEAVSVERTARQPVRSPEHDGLTGRLMDRPPERLTNRLADRPPERLTDRLADRPRLPDRSPDRPVRPEQPLTSSRASRLPFAERPSMERPASPERPVFTARPAHPDRPVAAERPTSPERPVVRFSAPLSRTPAQQAPRASAQPVSERIDSQKAFEDLLSGSLTTKRATGSAGSTPKTSGSTQGSQLSGSAPGSGQKAPGSTRNAQVSARNASDPQQASGRIAQLKTADPKQAPETRAADLKSAQTEAKIVDPKQASEAKIIDPKQAQPMEAGSIRQPSVQAQTSQPMTPAQQNQQAQQTAQTPQQMAQQNQPGQPVPQNQPMTQGQQTAQPLDQPSGQPVRQSQQLAQGQAVQMQQSQQAQQSVLNQQAQQSQHTQQTAQPSAQPGQQSGQAQQQHFAQAEDRGGQPFDRAWDRDDKGKFLSDRAERQTARNRRSVPRRESVDGMTERLLAAQTFAFGAAFVPGANVGRPAAQSAGPSAVSFGGQAAAQALDQVEKGMLSALNDGSTQLELQLNPLELGQVTVLLTSRNGEVSALIRAERPETAALLAQQTADLRANLEQQGIKVDKLDVQTEARDDQPDWQNSQAQQQAQQNEQREHLRRLNRLSRIGHPDRLGNPGSSLGSFGSGSTLNNANLADGGLHLVA